MISDTHSAGSGKDLPSKILDALRGVDLILHCGDLECLGVLDYLEEVAPLLAVRGYEDPVEEGDRVALTTRVVKAEGVSIGMMGAARMAQALGMIPQDLVDRQRHLLERFNLPTHAKGVPVEDIRRAMSLDKKVQSGSNRWVMLEEVGKAVVRQNVPQELVDETLQELVG